MKGLTTWSPVQKAKILFDWFPLEIAEFIIFETEMAQKISQDKEKLKSTWNENQVFPAAFWISLAESSAEKIKQHAPKIMQSASVFSEQLFDGDSSFFSKHCLLQFMIAQKSKYPKFKLAVELLFQ